MRISRAKSIIAATILITSGMAFAQSADAPNSRLNAYECGTLPQPLSLSVQVLDNADRFLKFKAHFEKQLRARGATVADNAPVQVTLDVRTVREFGGSSASGLIQLRIGQENEELGRDGTVYFRGNVWSNRSTSVLGGPKQRSSGSTLNQLQVSASINRRDNGRCVWQGELLHRSTTEKLY